MPFAKVKFIFFLNIKSSLFTFCCFGFVFRLQQEAELKLLEEETAKRLEEAIQKNVEERLNGFSCYALFGFAGCAWTGMTETEIQISFEALNLRNFYYLKGENKKALSFCLEQSVLGKIDAALFVSFLCSLKCLL